MSGFQFLEQLKHSSAIPSLSVNMLMTRGRNERLLELLHNATQFLRKPVLSLDFLTQIDRMLHKTNKNDQFIKAKRKHSVSESDQKWITKIGQYIQDNLSDVNLTVPDIAHAFAMSPSTLLRRVKMLTGRTVVNYIKEYRLQEGLRLLKEKPRLSIGLIASRVGYRDSRSFSRSFKKRFGRLPSDIIND